MNARSTSVIVAALLAATALPPAARAADPVATAFLAKTQSVPAGGTATFQVGVTSTDGTAWPAASVSVSVALLAADGTVIATSAPVNAPADVAPGETTFAFVDVALPQQAAGAVTARATISHAGTVAGSSDPLAIAVGTIAATAPAVNTPYSGQLADNNVFASRTAQSGTLSFNGTYGGGRSFQTNMGLSSTPGGQKPVVSVQTSGTITQAGTFAPSFDPLVMAGVTGEGVAFKRVWGANAVQVASISGAHATANPFTIDAVSFAHQLAGGWTIASTFGDERVDGDAPDGIPFFLRTGTLAGLTFMRPADAHGTSYALRFGAVDYEDEIAGRRRSDSAIEANIGFTIRKSAWTFDLTQAGPHFPNLSAPGVTPDRESESLQGTIPIGAVSLSAGVNGYRDALPGSPSAQKTHFFTESLGASTALRNGDTIALNLSNAVQHEQAQQSLFSGNDNTALTYTMKRGQTTYAFTLGSANQRDSLDNLQHTVQDGVTVTRMFGPSFTLSTGLSLTGNHATAMSGTSLLQALVSTATWTRGDITVSGSMNRARTIPYLGTAATPLTSLNYGVAFRPARSRTSLNATITQNYGAVSSSTSSLNLARQF